MIATAVGLRRGARRRALRVAFGLQHMVIGASLGLCGLLGWLMWAFTEHVVTYRNENQWLANPITFLALPIGIGIALGSPRMLKAGRYAFYTLAAMTITLVVLKLLPAFDQDTRLTLALLGPLNLGGALAHFLLARSATRDAPAEPQPATPRRAIAREPA